MNKKGALDWGDIAVIAVIAVGIVIFFNIWNPQVSYAGTVFSSETLKIKDSKCLLDMQRALERGSNPVDSDKDGRPDACDICINGPNEVDNDLDGMPAYCDKADNDRTIVACSRFLTKDGRCSDSAIS